MGAKVWMLVYSNGDVLSLWNSAPEPTKDRHQAICKTLFPTKKFTEIDNVTLAFANPRHGNVHITDLGAVLIVATEAAAIDNPSKLPASLINYPGYQYTYLFAMHSVVDWFAFAIWKNGNIVRSLSLSPDSGIIEDIGEHLLFEQDYWSGKQDAIDSEDDKASYPLPFHPLDFGEHVLLNLLGYQYEGLESLNKVDPECIVMQCYAPVKWWKFW